MASASETGHAVNLGNFKDLIAKAKGLGVKYVPSNPVLKLNNLQMQVNAAEALNDDVKMKKGALATAINDRQGAYGDLKTTATRVVNSFQSAVTDKAARADLATINKKIQSAKKPKVDPNNLTDKVVSTSQQSFDQQKDHWKELIAFLRLYPLYAPNEAYLKITALQDMVTAMETAEATYNPVKTAHENALIARNAAFYGETTGLVDTTKSVKSYAKSADITAEQYQIIKKIPFRVIKSGD